jgi:thiol-disulfide isomerase/thioredoxin
MVVGLSGVVISACGSGDQPAPGPAPHKLSRAQLKAVPKQIAANLRQANQVIDGSIEAKLAALRGVPVVVNQWASWCPSCKAEFPLFQRLSKQLQGKVAFLGLDSQDSRGDAEAFLKQYPVNYPSIFDQSASQAASIGGGRGWPTTIYFNRLGQRTFVHLGGYTTAMTLRGDIERYALAKRG